jgi:hypothetical protein
VTFSAGVNAQSPRSGTPTGTVTFMDGSNVLGMGTLSDGVATFSTTTLSIGTHSITAVYGGDDNITTSTSAVLKQKVKKSSDASIAVVSTNGPADIVQSFTATATYDGAFPMSARAPSRIMAGLASVDGLRRGRPSVDHGAGSGDPRPTVDHGAGSGDPRPTYALVPLVDLAIGTLQDEAGVSPVDDLAVDVIAVRSRRRVR